MKAEKQLIEKLKELIEFYRSKPRCTGLFPPKGYWEWFDKRYNLESELSELESKLDKGEGKTAEEVLIENIKYGNKTSIQDFLTPPYEYWLYWKHVIKAMHEYAENYHASRIKKELKKQQIADSYFNAGLRDNKNGI